MPLTTHCRNCGASKSPNEFILDYCSACDTAVKEAREFVVKENDARNVANAKIIAEKQAAILSGQLTPEDAGLKPLLDISNAAREALLRRAPNTQATKADPRAPFDPGVGDPRMANLGMGAHIPTGARRMA